MTFSVLEHLLAFIVAIGVLVTVHEFGHFWVARRLGVKVLRFSVGFGKALWRRVGADGTEYMIAWVPLGGYVKMLDEREGPVPPKDLPRSFSRRPHWQRMLVMLAGPGSNVLFAILLLTGIFLVNGITDVRPVLGPIGSASPIGRIGLRAGDRITSIDGHPVGSQREVLLQLLEAVSSSAPVTVQARAPDGALHGGVLPLAASSPLRRLTDPVDLLARIGLQFVSPPTVPAIASVQPGEPAARAGLKRGDQLLSVDGVSVRTPQELIEQITPRAGQTVLIRYRRNGALAEAHVQVARHQASGRTVGRIGIAVVPMQVGPYPKNLLRHTSLSLPQALVHASAESWNITALQGVLFWRMVVGRVSIKSLSGPVGIAQAAGAAAAAGVASFLSFLVLISLALAFMNLLPIPILDGGQVLFQVIEWLKGSPLSERFLTISQQLGVALVVLLFLVVTFNDLTRQFG